MCYNVQLYRGEFLSLKKYFILLFLFMVSLYSSELELKDTSNDLDTQRIVIELDDNEKEFIKNHNIRCVTTTTWAPFNTKLNGKPVGIALDYWDEIVARTGLKSKCKVLDSWNDVLEAIKTKKADVTLGTSITKDRQKYAEFSEPYASFPIAIATRNDKSYISSTAFLRGKKVAVGKNYTAYLLLKKFYPKINFVPVKNTDEALMKVSKGEAFAAIDILPILTYNMSKRGYTSLKISGITEFDFDVRLMIRKDYQELVSIVNKGIASIDEIQKNSIHSKWISVKYENGFDYSLFWKIVVVFVIIVVFIFYRNRQLVKHQKEMQEKNFELEQTKQQLLQSKLKLEKLASEDSLTGLYNRRKFDEYFDIVYKTAMRNKSVIAVGMIDIDYFKAYNDSYGHKAGDNALIAVTHEIKNTLHRPCDIVARYGGEEFIFLILDIDESGFEYVLEKMRSNIEKLNISHKASKTKDVLTVSIGGVIGTVGMKSNRQKFFTQADELLYEAKDRGRNQVVVSEI